jgi:hypothetical protein
MREFESSRKIIRPGSCPGRHRPERRAAGADFSGLELVAPEYRRTGSRAFPDDDRSAAVDDGLGNPVVLVSVDLDRPQVAALAGAAGLRPGNLEGIA